MTVLAAYYELLTAIAEPWQEWRERANCRGLGPDMFFAERGESVAEAKAVCACCEVRAECLEFAQTHIERHGGVWGGLSDRQRRSRRRVDPERNEGARRERIGAALRGTHPRRNGAA